MNTSELQQTFSSREEGLKATAVLNNGLKMPWMGLGVFQIASDSKCETVVRTAIQQGYRSVDTAALYGNEKGVGQAIKSCGIPRSELFITTKAWNDDLRRNRVEAAFEESLRRLGLDYVDLYLLHWPVKGKIISSWKVLEKLYQSGRIKAIGVSNHMIPHLEELLAIADVVPAVNQIEFHPYLQSQELVHLCRERGIQVEAWSPLMQAGRILKDPTLLKIAKAHGKTAAQVILRWDVQSGVITIPKSEKPARIAENADIFDFALSDTEMAELNGLERGQRSGADPFNFNF